MFLFGHVGITIGLAQVAQYSLVKKENENTGLRLDYRLVALGSMLPDIIDKPLGGLILGDYLGNGRIYCHTFIFLLPLFVLGMIFWYQFKKPVFLILAGGSLVHQVLDSMWLYPETLLWPAYGLSFPRGNVDLWLSKWMKSLTTDPGVNIPEIAGVIIILCFLSGFSRTGKFKEA